MITDKYTFGFIGIGLMGKPMTLRLLNAGFWVNVWSRSQEKLKPVTDAGASPFSSVSELVQSSDVIILCLADTPAVESIVTGNILDYGSADKLLIDLSSIHPKVTRPLASSLYDSCCMSWVNAPVSGGVAGAEQGSLAIMAGGKPEHIEIAREVLAPLYKQLTHMGDIGSGQATR